MAKSSHIWFLAPFSSPGTFFFPGIVSQRSTAGIRPDVGVGEGWMLEGLKRLTIAANGVGYQPGDGTIRYFVKNSDGLTYTRPVGVFASLTFSDGKYTLEDKFGTKSIFNSTGRLDKEIDRNSRETNYTYRSDGQLDKITDSYGRTVVLKPMNVLTLSVLVIETNAAFAAVLA